MNTPNHLDGAKTESRKSMIEEFTKARELAASYLDSILSEEGKKVFSDYSLLGMFKAELYAYRDLPELGVKRANKSIRRIKRLCKPS